MHPARLRTVALSALTALASVLAADRASAQSRDRPLLVISMTAGFLTGGELWRLDRQLAAVGGGSSDIDSLALGRYFRTGFLAGVGATLFRSPHLGITADVTFLGLATESRCAPRGPYAFDTHHINEQTCISVQGNRVATNAAAIQLGAVWRALPGARTHPFLRVTAGAALLGGSFVETSGLVPNPSTDPTQPAILARFLLSEGSRREVTWIATLGAGVMFDVSPGYLVRFEARDVLMGLPVVTGPGSIVAAYPVAQTANRTVHLPAFAVTFDLVLEPVRRPRRY
jgi:hypothetical protein